MSEEETALKLGNGLKGSLTKKSLSAAQDLSEKLENVSINENTNWADLDDDDFEDIDESVPTSVPSSAPNPLAGRLQPNVPLSGSPGSAPPPSEEPPVNKPVNNLKNLNNLVQNQNDVQVSLSDQQADANSPLYSVHSFEELGLSSDLLKGIYAMKFEKPSKVQERALPLLLNDPPTNMIAQSQSGTGKTAAFVLTMLSRVDPNVAAPQAICLAPARELARQIIDVVNLMGKYTNISVGYAIPQGYEKDAKFDQQIIVGTPGTVSNLIKRKMIETDRIKVFVLDEADNMLDMQGLGDQCVRIRLRVPKTCQIVLFSATYTDKVREFAEKLAPNANQITLKQEELSVDGIKQLYWDCPGDNARYEALLNLYGLMTIGSSIIFCRTRATANEIQKRLTEDGHLVSLLHSELEPSERDKVIDDFRTGKSKVLISTNVLARGIDVSSVSMVINYDVPTTADNQPDPETYLHRIGRTGRFGRVGVSITFVHDQTSLEQLMAIEKFFGRPMLRIPDDDLEEAEKIIKAVISS
ncbi:hypothetical protein CANCADRAFT_48686 [Tortispora caseinolytica NRRL Y-17796]|uniref:RNA helicase n=1 Tax=Tortispora caseinolytica NRRL Y-17796 TaxID=767744 RepID=A0A1E4TLH5_9ASCO|nr:hypothetical protein CANCADRAFT_48686 [Tortispora caseinolytica NRRL Y-17796]